MIDKPLLQRLRADLNSAIAAVGTRHGVTLHVGSASFTTTTTKFRLDVRAVVDGVVVDPAVEAFKQRALLYGLKPDDLGRKFAYGGRLHTVQGLRTGVRKNPIIVKRDDGKGYRFAAETVARLLPPTSNTTYET